MLCLTALVFGFLELTNVETPEQVLGTKVSNGAFQASAYIQNQAVRTTFQAPQSCPRLTQSCSLVPCFELMHWVLVPLLLLCPFGNQSFQLPQSVRGSANQEQLSSNGAISLASTQATEVNMAAHIKCVSSFLEANIYAKWNELRWINAISMA